MGKYYPISCNSVNNNVSSSKVKNNNMANNNDKNGLVYMLAGFGFGTILGAVAGVLFAPHKGKETREKLTKKLTIAL